MRCTGRHMALYSWFDKNNNKPSKTSVRANHNLLKTAKPAKYIENFTVWPTVKIKKNIEAILPVYNDVENKLANEHDEPKTPLNDELESLKTILLINK